MLRVSIGTGSSVSIVTLAIVDKVVKIVGVFVTCSVSASVGDLTEVVADCIVDSRMGLSVVSSTVCGFFVVGD